MLDRPTVQVCHRGGCRLCHRIVVLSYLIAKELVHLVISVIRRQKRATAVSICRKAFQQAAICSLSERGQMNTSLVRLPYLNTLTHIWATDIWSCSFVRDTLSPTLSCEVFCAQARGAIEMRRMNTADGRVMLGGFL